MMQDYTALSVEDIRNGLANGSFSAREITQAAFDQIEKTDADVHAFLELTQDLAFEQADKIDHAVAAGEKLGLLD